MRNVLEGKVVLVTGAGSGIGQAAAISFATNGATVIVSDIEINDTISLIKSKRGDVEFKQADVSHLRDCSRLVKKTMEQYGKLDIAFNSAVISDDKNFSGDINTESFNRIISTNLCGVFYCMKYEIQAMLGQGGGIIINSPDVLGYEGADSSIGYVAARHGIIGLTQDAALKYAGKNISIHCVSQKIVNAPLLETIDVKARTTSSLQHQRVQQGRAEEIAAMILWLSSGKASINSKGYYSGEDFCSPN